jgi:hypothetical protein
MQNFIPKYILLCYSDIIKIKSITLIYSLHSSFKHPIREYYFSREHQNLAIQVLHFWFMEERVHISHKNGL